MDGYNSQMKIASISHTKNQLSALIDKVRHGETILIMDRDRPVARLEPVLPEDQVDGRLIQLERDGIIHRAPNRTAERILEEAPPKTSSSLLKALLAEREEGR